MQKCAITISTKTNKKTPQRQKEAQKYRAHIFFPKQNKNLRSRSTYPPHKHNFFISLSIEKKKKPKEKRYIYLFIISDLQQCRIST